MCRRDRNPQTLSMRCSSLSNKSQTRRSRVTAVRPQVARDFELLGRRCQTRVKHLKPLYQQGFTCDTTEQTQGISCKFSLISQALACTITLMATRRDARRSLDRRFDTLRQLVDEPRPHRGWIRAIRDALGMSSSELGHRLGVSQQTMAEFEGNEQRGTIRLDTLRRAADGLDCDLVYVLVPRQSLEAMVQQRATIKARNHVNGVSHHSRLEDQQPGEIEELDQIRDVAQEFVDRRGLWSDPSSLEA